VKGPDSLPQARGFMPFLGHAVPLVRHPLEFISSLPAYGDLVRIRLGPVSLVLVCDPALTRQVLLDDRTFDKGGPLFERGREVAGDGLLTVPHSRHRRQRRLCQPSFHPERLKAYAPVMASSAESMAASWHDGQVIDLTAELRALAMRTAVETMFSPTALPPETATRVVDDFTTVEAGAFRQIITPPPLNRLPGAGSQRYNRARASLRRTVGEIISARRNAGTDRGDLLSSLQDATDPHSPGEHPALTDEELIDQVLTFLFAGTVTTADTVAWALYLLARHPEIDGRLRSETDSVLSGAPLSMAQVPALTMADRVITETLRLYPPGWLFTRKVMNDAELGGVSLPAGTTIAYSPYLIHHRPDLYEDPDRFDPDRWHGARPDRAAYFAFGAGARKCIGDRFGSAEAVLILTAITSRWRLVPVTDAAAQPRARILLSPGRLRMRVLKKKAGASPHIPERNLQCSIPLRRRRCLSALARSCRFSPSMPRRPRRRAACIRPASRRCVRRGSSRCPCPNGSAVAARGSPRRPAS
jgi:cytochrome P450